MIHGAIRTYIRGPLIRHQRSSLTAPMESQEASSSMPIYRAGTYITASLRVRLRLDRAV